MVSRPDTAAQRRHRHKRVRGKISGTAERPRLNIFRSSNHIYAQLINDVTGTTLAAASSQDKSLGDIRGNAEGAAKVGKLLGERAVKVGISEVVFDRGGYLYHGRVKALADGARESGLKF